MTAYFVSIFIYFIAYFVSYREVTLLHSYFVQYTTQSNKFGLARNILIAFIPFVNIYTAIGYFSLKGTSAEDLRATVILYARHKKIRL